MKVTIEDVIMLERCDDYPVEKLLKLSNGQNEMSLQEIAALDVPSADLLWLLVSLMDNEKKDLFVRMCALRVIHLWDAPEIVIRYLNTGDESIRDEAHCSALAARYAPARYKRYEVWSAVEAIRFSENYGEWWFAARYAAYGDSREAQVDIAIEILEECNEASAD